MLARRKGETRGHDPSRRRQTVETWSTDGNHMENHVSVTSAVPRIISQGIAGRKPGRLGRLGDLLSTPRWGRVTSKLMALPRCIPLRLPSHLSLIKTPLLWREWENALHLFLTRISRSGSCREFATGSR